MPSFIDNVDAVVSKLGTSNVGLVWGLANANWENDFERDSFIEMITQPKSGA
jgi:hypothetical protein